MVKKSASPSSKMATGVRGGEKTSLMFQFIIWFNFNWAWHRKLQMRMPIYFTE